MKPCEYCHLEHDETYGSGRFCSVRCVRQFASFTRREETNKKLSAALKGRSHPNFMSPEGRLRAQVAVTNRHKNIFLQQLESWSTNKSIFSTEITKHFLVHLYGNKCQKCGWCEIHPVTGNIPIQIHHKDGNKKNNHKDNVMLLCPNCHSLTPNYMALNYWLKLKTA